MARSRREQLLIIGVATAVGLFALDYYIRTPFVAAGERIAKDTEIARIQLNANRDLFRKKRVMEREWAVMTTDGLQTGTWEAERSMFRSMQEWAQKAGITNVSLRSEHGTTEHGYLKVTIHVTGSGTSAAMAKLMWSIESTNVPVRVESLQLVPASSKDATDELKLTLSASRLCAVPDGEKKPVGTGSRQAIAAKETRP